MTVTTPIETYFAPAERVSFTKLREQIHFTLEHPLIKVVLEAVEGYVLILNAQRQMLACNQELLDALQINYPEQFAGLRPGEILNCSHASEGPNGCGTGLHCQSCGAVLTILAAQNTGEVASGECRMSINKEGSFAAADFKVKATPVLVNNQPLLAVVLQDISACKRREVLEQVFLHDFLNTVGGIQGWSEQLNYDPQMAAQQILFLSHLLKEEIHFHTLLTQAENNDLKIKVGRIHVTDILKQLDVIFKSQFFESGKTLQISFHSSEDHFLADPVLLLRVLINMVKNASESSSPGEMVSVYFEWQGHHPVFHVHNMAYIDPADQEHIFERSFSTKGHGRGIGTYSMKLFGEKYLKGRVFFETHPQTGTTFTIALPDLFPVLEDEENIDQPVSKGLEPKMNQSSTVLLVDDDESHALLGRLLLERLGYQVLVKSSGQEAIETLKSNPNGFACIITDYTMEPMDGLETARNLLTINQDAIVLLCTGRDDPKLINAARATGIRRTALKPSTREEMFDLLESAGVVQLD